MKKFLTGLLLSFVLLVSSCGGAPEYKVNYKLTYRVHYPSTVTEYTYRFKGTDDAHVYLRSNDGTNYILVIYDGEVNDPLRHRTSDVCDTTAPIEIVSLEKVY